MNDTIVVAILALLGTLCGSWAGVRQANKLVNFRIDELEKKVEKHNNLVERTAVIERDIKTAFKKIDKLEEKAS
ncbi:hypothetical protein LJC07_06195 [Christensenellaceae bacterium OttesenSCG-928-L17]|nr:hypothetical protein [Christensenellaceae bacterium OttesenSCG-928-L17]